MLDLTPLLLTIKIAIISTIILLVVAIFLAWWLSVSNSLTAKIVEIICLIPLLLPPTVLGFYLLIAFNQNSLVGKWFLHSFGYSITFSQVGLVIGSIIYSLPFMLQPLQNSFNHFPRQLIKQAQCWGKNNLTILFKVVLPNCISGIIAGCILSFMHTLGEFGVVLMIGGNIPNKTQMVSMKIYEDVQLANYNSAHLYALILIILAFMALLLLNFFNKKRKIIHINL